MARPATAFWLLALGGCLAPPKEASEEPGGDSGVLVSIPGPTDGLIAYWPMDDISEDRLLHEVIADHDGSCVRCPIAAAGKVGAGALRFREDDFAIVPWLDLELEAGTISAWVFVDTIIDAAILSRPYGGEALDSFLLGTFADGVVFLEYRTGFDQSAADLVEGEWNHIAGSWSPEGRAIYVNGSGIEFGPREVAYEESNLYIGSDYDFGVDVYHWKGAIDDLRLYDRALEPSEIAEILAL